MFCHWRRKFFNIVCVCVCVCVCGGGETLVLTGLLGGGGGTSHFHNYWDGGWPLLPTPTPTLMFVEQISIQLCPSHNLNPMGRPYPCFACSVENISTVLFPVSVR